MSILITVIIPTYNPDTDRLNLALQALKEQTLDADQWELIIVDNNSSNSFSSLIDIRWHPHYQLLLEAQQGLTYARLKGFDHSKTGLIVMVDDDNILDHNYLQNVIEIFNAYPTLGAAGGKSLPIFESPPPEWLTNFYGSLALRDLGNAVLIEHWENKYPSAAPIGAGMAIRKTALLAYLKKVNSNTIFSSDRSGNSLASGGDNEIVLNIIKSGWQTGYFPQLRLQHIIPEARMQKAYLARLEKQTNYSWVQLLVRYQICPWQKISPNTVMLRKLKAYFTCRVWQNRRNYIKWQGACGIFEALAN